MIRLPDAVVARLARKNAGVAIGLVGGSPAGGVCGGLIGTATTRAVTGSSRWRPAGPITTTFPSLPTAIASGRDPIVYSAPRCRVLRFTALIVFDPRFATYSVLRSGLSARLPGCTPTGTLPVSLRA